MSIENGFRVDTKCGDFQIEQSLKSVFNGQEQEISRIVVKLQDQGIRDALIAVGWTPPKSD